MTRGRPTPLLPIFSLVHSARSVVDERSDWIERLQNQVDVQKAAEQIEALIDLFGGLVFEVALQLTAQALVAAL